MDSNLFSAYSKPFAIFRKSTDNICLFIFTGFALNSGALHIAPMSSAFFIPFCHSAVIRLQFYFYNGIKFVDKQGLLCYNNSCIMRM